MQTANLLLNLAGSRDQQVQKFGVTPPEAALLMALHGTDALSDIEITGDRETSSAEERERLTAFYARTVPGGGNRAPGRACPELDALFPGLRAKLPEEFADLGLHESLFKTPPKAAEPAPKKGRGKKAEAEAVEPTGGAEDANGVMG